MSETYDPGDRVCGHEHRIHSMGGGILVCFACWLKVVARVGYAEHQEALQRAARTKGG